MADGQFGWVGKILRVDLAKETSREESTAKYSEHFIGGMGIATKIMWDEIQPETSPFSPENRLIFMTGPLTGTLAPTSGRVEVCTKAPGVQPPSCTRSGLGGNWGPELKFSGYDGLIIQGKADRPTYLWIEDGEVKFEDACKLWGLDTYSTQKRLMEKHGEEVKTVCIGPAGENLVKFSVILSGTGYAAAKTGMGAVMGSKNLKAITVRGEGGVKIAKPEEFKEICTYVRRLILRHPVSKWASQGPIPANVEFVKRNRVRYEACFNCPVTCRAWIEIPGLESGEAMCLAWWYLWAGAVDDKAAWEGKVLSDKLGLCQFQLYSIVRWLTDLRKEGIITDEKTGIPWGRLGEREFTKILLNKIAWREGFGSILAEGPAEVAKRLGGRAEAAYGCHFPNYGQAEHYSVRSYPVILMQWATDNRDPLCDAHDWTVLVYWAHLYWPEGQRGKLTFDQCKKLAKGVWGSEKAAEPYSYEDKAKVAVLIQNLSRIKCSLVLCDWSIFPVNTSPNMPEYRGDTDVERRMFCAATGVEVDKDDWFKIGERIFNLERAILVREGRRREDDTVNECNFRTPETDVPAWEIARSPPPVVNREKFEMMKNEYYSIRGWDIETGVPKKEKLEELGLEDVVSELQRRRCL
ncbi:MAG: aldehyde ferredoxin oxidoreductase N-terminal domain-containing protein [Nitrososphaerota archaeon]